MRRSLKACAAGEKMFAQAIIEIPTDF